MAEVIVNSLLVKLGDAILQEAIMLYNVQDKVESVKCELERIQSFLKDADAKRNNGDNTEEVKTWVKQVRGVSFLIEDAIDIFLLKVEKGSLKQPGCSNIVKRVTINPIIKLFGMHGLNSAIDKIEATLQAIQKSKDRYNIIKLGESVVGIARLHTSPPVVPEAHEIDLVGFDAEREKIIGLLLDKNTLRRSVVSIAGTGGCGKTALAEKVYQSAMVKNHFDVRVWLNVQGFTRANLLRKILEKIRNKSIKEDDYDEDILCSHVIDELKQKRYFIVLDGIWERDLWSQITDILPNVDKASRVLITTRSTEIARAAGPTTLELRPLNEDESLKLLFKKAFLGESFNEGYPMHLRGIATKFSEKCDGLPLALVVVGGLLSTRDPNSWDRVLPIMDWKTHANQCLEILGASYEDLPVNLKPCFMYFASFPEHYEHDADLLSWLWISEGFIPHDAHGTMEEIANDYIEQLAQRCMIEVLKKSLDGSIACFRVQNLLLEIAIREAQEKDFLKVISKADDFDNTGVARRATFQLNDSSRDETSFDQEKKLTKKTNRNIRTLISFGKAVPFSSEFKLLRVLMISHYNGSAGDTFPDLLTRNLKKLLQLRCLGFVGCNFHSEVVLPIDNLNKLLVLVIRSCQGIVVPWSLWKIKTLRHVFVDSWCDSTQGGVSEPVDVHNLQTLGQVIITKPGFGLLKIKSLLKLHLTIEDDSWDGVIKLLSKLAKLVSLTIEAIIIPLEIFNTKEFSSNECLRTLCLKGTWNLKGEVIRVDMFPPQLTMLTLISSHVDENSLKVLEKLTSIKILVLEMAYIGKKMVCSTGGFSRLQKLILSMMRIEELVIEKGAIPVLDHLEIHSCERLKMLPDLQHVRTLKVLSLRYMPKEFMQRIHDEDKHKIEHIRYIHD